MKDRNTWHVYSTIATMSPDRVYAGTKESWESGGLLAPTVSNLDPREIDASQQISIEFLSIVIHFPPLPRCTGRKDPPILNT